MFPAITRSLVERYDAAGPRYTSYPPVPVWIEAVGAEAHARALEEAAASAGPLSMYVHLPFCRARCAFCGCNVVISDDPKQADRYIDYVARELDLVLEHLGTQRELSQLHWGGGTPTFLNEPQLLRLFTEIARRLLIQREAELAIEIDPRATTESQLELLRGVGFNRISFGIQDFDPAVQDAIGRRQSEDECRRLVEKARHLGFSGVNFDLIYGLPRQTLQSWGATLERVLDLRPDRLAVYSFAYLPDQRKQQRKLPFADLPLGADKLSLFGKAYDVLTTAGYQPIGMDHFALETDELARAQRERALRRNFQGYTVLPADDVIALGISGISRVGRLFAQNMRGLSQYYDAIDARELPTMRGWVLSDDDLARERVIRELMCNHITDLGHDVPAHFASELDALRKLEADGLLSLRNRTVELTPLGRIFVRNVAMVFDAYLDSEATYSRTV